MILVKTSFGLRGAIVPLFNKSQSWDYGFFQLSVESGVCEIGYEDEALEGSAREVVKRYLAAHNFENGTNYHVDLNVSWRMDASGSKAIAIEFCENLSITASLSVQVTQVTSTGGARLVSPGFDSDALDNQTTLVNQCHKDPALASALMYFNEEVIEDEHPLYGIYKAIEALTKAIPGGREALGMLVGHNKNYVGDVMVTAQLTRHHNDPDAKRVLTDEECKERAKILIRGYANTVQI